MKIVAINKTLNEERNIAGFCRGYDFCDLILVADGGSTDRTVEIAETFKKVKVRQFTQRLELPDGTFMNPEPAHVNFLIDWAVDEGADWIILDGCDCWPNPKLHKMARRFFHQAETNDKDAVLLYRLYMFGEDKYFPKINQPGPALWAWRPARLDLRTDETNPTYFDAVMPGPDLDRVFVIDRPFVCLHYFDPASKAARYAAWGHPQTPIEQSIYWPPEPLPAWATEE